MEYQTINEQIRELITEREYDYNFPYVETLAFGNLISRVKF